MNRVTWKHAVAWLALLATLSLVAPAPAQAAAWGAGGRGDAWSEGWSWMSSLWDGWVAMFGGGGAPRVPAPAKQRRPDLEKSTTDSSGGTTSGDNGPAINPDGQPPV